MSESGLKKKSTISAVWAFMTSIVSQLRNFIVSLILARLISPSDFGVLGMAMVFAGLVETFVDFGFSNAVIQKQTISQNQLSTVFFINVSIGCVFSTIMFFLSGFIADFFKMEVLNDIVKIMSLTFVVKGVEAIPMALLKKDLNYRKIFKIQVVAGCVSGVCGIGFAYAGLGVWALVFSQIIGWVISTVGIWLCSTWRPILYFNLREVKDLWNFGYKCSLMIFIDSIFNRLDTIIIGKCFSAEPLGLFYRAQSLNRLIVQYSFGSYSSVLLPTLSKVAEDSKRLIKSMHSILHLVCFLTFLLSGLLYISSRDIIYILYGEKWLGAVPYFEILSFFSFIITIPNLLATTLICAGKTGLGLKIEIIKKIGLLFSIPVGIYYGELFGYVFATRFFAAFAILLNILALRSIGNRMMDTINVIFAYGMLFVLSILSITYLKSICILSNSIMNVLIFSILYSLIYIALNFSFKLNGVKLSIELVNSAIRKAV